jgi:hypothetical protein
VLASLSFFRVASLRGSIKIKAYSNKSWRLLRCPLGVEFLKFGVTTNKHY